MSEPVQFAFSKARLFAIAVCALLSGLLVFGAGVATGWLTHPNAADLKPTVTVSNPLPSATAAPAVAPADQNKTVEASDSSSSTAVDKSEEGVIVNVASFPQRGSATNLAAMLKRQGFGPVHTGQHEIQGQASYYVHVGPFPTWEDASKIAAELDQSYNLHTSVIPAKSAS